ncbi:MAG: hypothetical protein V4449_03950 [Patescibacteria group bacterium]
MSEITSIGGKGFLGRDSRRVQPVKPIVRTGLGERPPKEHTQEPRKNKEDGKGVILDFEA